jgi:hypothetical protein
MKSCYDAQHRSPRRLVAASLALAILASQAMTPGLALAAAGTAKTKPEPAARTKPKAEPAARPRSKPGDAQPQVSPVVEACVDHHTNAQELRMAGKLLESREALRECAAEACPALLQRDCVGWLEQVDKQIPSITFRVTVDGQSSSDVRVFVDGSRAHQPESGRAVELNPGRHELRVEQPGVAAFEEQIVLSEGERYRLVEVSMTSPPRPPPKPEVHRPVPVMTYVLGSLAIAGAVSGGIWGASSMSLRKDLEDTCSPSCPDRRVDELRQRALFTDISFGVSALSLLGATALFVFRPEVPVEVDVAWLPDGGGLGSVRVKAF